MDLAKLYTDKELAEKRISFLKRVLLYYENMPNPHECAKIVGHKLSGTGGTLGITSIMQLGTELQMNAEKGVPDSEIIGQLDQLKPKIVKEIQKFQRIFEE